MATAPEPVIDETDGVFFEAADNFKKRGNWTEERRELNITAEEFDAQAMRICAEHPERYSTPEELRAKLARIEEAQPARRRAEMAGA
jgi:hypothetical protein